MAKSTAFLLIFICVTTGVMAQESLLTLKRGAKTIKTWSSGSPIRFSHYRAGGLSGMVREVTADSLRLNLFQVQRLESSKGFVFFDTLYSGTYTIGLNEITWLHTENSKKFAFKTSEFTAYLASALFSVMAVVNGVKFNDKFSTSLTQAAVRGGSLFMLGRLFHWLGRSDFRLGKKYRLSVLDLRR